mmetsp:Transcript_12873/g.22236  ORF Transcript_12873/g.22236 Transcript_12873/m.22236 type:complete len:340 (-) Transcript_12873:452-1471(-)
MLRGSLLLGVVEGHDWVEGGLGVAGGGEVDRVRNAWRRGEAKAVVHRTVQAAVPRRPQHGGVDEVLGAKDGLLDGHVLCDARRNRRREGTPCPMRMQRVDPRRLQQSKSAVVSGEQQVRDNLRREVLGVHLHSLCRGGCASASARGVRLVLVLGVAFLSRGDAHAQHLHLLPQHLLLEPRPGVAAQVVPQMPALEDDDPRAPAGEVLGGAHHAAHVLDPDAGEDLSLGHVGGDHVGEGNKELTHQTDRRGLQQGLPPLRSKDGVDHDGNVGGLVAYRFDHRLEYLLPVHHARLDAVHPQVAHHKLDLAPHEFRHHPNCGPNTAAVLSSHGCDSSKGVAA